MFDKSFMDSRITSLSRILLIDGDGEIALLIMNKLLEVSGFTGQIDHVKNGYEGLLYISERWVNRLPYPDIIFVNYDMPVMDGFEFLKHCRTAQYFENEPVKLIMFTLSDHESVVKEAFSYGVHGYMNKCFTVERLLKYL